MTRKLAGFGLAFALAELAAAYLPPLASLLTAALFISLFLFCCLYPAPGGPLCAARRGRAAGWPGVERCLPAGRGKTGPKPGRANLCLYCHWCSRTPKPPGSRAMCGQRCLSPGWMAAKPRLKYTAQTCRIPKQGISLPGSSNCSPCGRTLTACPAMPRVRGWGHPIRRIISGRKPRMRCRTGCTTCGRRLPNG